MKFSLALALIAALLFTSSVFAADSYYPYLEQTPDERIIYLAWDCSMDPAFTVESNTNNALGQSITDFTLRLFQDFFQDLAATLKLRAYKQDKAAELKIQPVLTDIIHFELISSTLLRARVYFNSTQGFASGYESFMKATTADSLSSIVSNTKGFDIAPTGTYHKFTAVSRVFSYYISAKCGNFAIDDNETDVDCGGSSDCPRCDTGKICKASSDCIEYTQCENIDEATGNGQCSKLSMATPQRKYEENRKDTNSASAVSTGYFAFAFTIAVIVAIAF